MRTLRNRIQKIENLDQISKKYEKKNPEKEYLGNMGHHKKNKSSYYRHG